MAFIFSIPMDIMSCFNVIDWIPGPLQFIFFSDFITPLKKNLLNFSYAYDTNAFIEHISIGFIQTMIVFIEKWQIIWLSSPSGN